MGLGFLGKVDEWTTGDAKQKARLQQLSATSSLKNSNRDAAHQRLEANVQKRQAFAKQFLRGCLANAEHLSKTSVFGERAKTLVNDLTSVVANDWRNHTQATSAALAACEENIRQLRQIYRMGGN